MRRGRRRPCCPASRRTGRGADRRNTEESTDHRATRGADAGARGRPVAGIAAASGYKEAQREHGNETNSRNQVVSLRSAETFSSIQQKALFYQQLNGRYRLLFLLLSSNLLK